MSSAIILFGCNYFDLVADPKIVIQPKVAYAAAPFGGIFTCSAMGYGNLSISWSRIGDMLPDKSNIAIDSSEILHSTLEIPNATTEDAGIYLCIVQYENGKTPESATATLHISGTYVVFYLESLYHVCVKLCNMLVLITLILNS